LEYYTNLIYQPVASFNLAYRRPGVRISRDAGRGSEGSRCTCRAMTPAY
jgi:hypothetical protein